MMKNKNAILITIIVVLLAASGIILWRMYSGEPLQFAPLQMNKNDVIIRDKMDKVDAKMNKIMKKIRPGGDMDALAKSEQFAELSPPADKINIPDVTGRPNPFLPIDYSGGEVKK